MPASDDASAFALFEPGEDALEAVAAVATELDAGHPASARLGTDPGDGDMEELVEGNPATRAERPKLPRRKWRILEPAEVGRVARSFADSQARAVFLTLVLTGMRRSELQRLRWRDVDLVEATLRVRESKSEDVDRLVALPPLLLAGLLAHLERTTFKGADELVFCHPKRGTVYRAETFKAALDAAMRAADVEGRVRAFHDLRHASLTNGAAAGESPIALMARAGHASMRTTNAYLHLAGVVFREEAACLEERLLGATSSDYRV